MQVEHSSTPVISTNPPAITTVAPIDQQINSNGKYNLTEKKIKF